MTVALEEIQPVLHEILAAHPAGMSEYDLLMGLAGRDIGLFNEDYFNSPIGLFHRHFLLFHCLYQLREKLRVTGQGDMTIHCLRVRIIPCCNVPSSFPVLPDPLAVYYLDLVNLRSTSEADVLQMLDNFWKKFAGEDQRDEALAVMELTHPTSFPAIKRQYRKLAMQHHPDRGGDPAQFQQLERAMGILRVLYQ